MNWQDSIVRLGSCGFAFLVSGCGHSAPPVSPNESPALEQEAEQQARAAGPAAQRLGPTLHGVAYEKSQVTDWQVPLHSGQCYYFGYAADPDLSRVGMFIWDASGHRVDSERGRSRAGVVKYCATSDGVHRIQGKSMAGAGHFAVVPYVEAGPVVVAPPVAGPVDLAQIIEQQAAAAAGGSARIGEYFSASASQSDWTIAMDPGRCYWIIGAGEPDKVSKLYLYLWDPKNSRLTESRTDNNVAMIGYCAKEPGMYKFQAKVASGSGQYKVGVFAK